MIHIWAGVFVFWGVASSRWLISENLQVFLTINTCIGAILNILLNYILIPKIGIAGAAWATLISYFVASYLCLLFFKKTRINFINLTKSIFFVGVLGVEKKT
jgi:Na+-driven multidrug efflux pump